MLHEAVIIEINFRSENWQWTVTSTPEQLKAEGQLFSLWVLKISKLPVWSATIYLLVSLMYSLYCVWMCVCLLQDGLVCALQIMWIKRDRKHHFWHSLYKSILYYIWKSFHVFKCLFSWHFMFSRDNPHNNGLYNSVSDWHKQVNNTRYVTQSLFVLCSSSPGNIPAVIMKNLQWCAEILFLLAP